MDDYQKRKAERVAKYKATEGFKKIPCVCCNGSGRYDHNGSPRCGACLGAGKEKVSPERYEEYQKFLKQNA